MNSVEFSNYIGIRTSQSIEFSYTEYYFKNRIEPSLTDIAPYLKQELLLLDQVGILGLEFVIQHYPLLEIRPELEWLLNQNLLFIANLDLPQRNSISEKAFLEFLQQIGIDIDIWNEVEKGMLLYEPVKEPLREELNKIEKKNYTDWRRYKAIYIQV